MIYVTTIEWFILFGKAESLNDLFFVICNNYITTTRHFVNIRQ